MTVEPFKIEPFKIQNLTPKQSEIVQEFMGENLWRWPYSSIPAHTDARNLYFNESMMITYDNGGEGYFKRNHLPELTFEQFKEKYMEKNELKITKERVIEAAKSCTEAKSVLQKLFPEVFEDDQFFDLSQLKTIQDVLPYIFTDYTSQEAGFLSSSFFQIRKSGSFANRAFYLGSEYHWKIEIDNMGEACLVPRRKK